jgi:hypothetical protein
MFETTAVYGDLEVSGNYIDTQELRIIPYFEEKLPGPMTSSPMH